MTPIKIPETLKPDASVMYGYTGGMALYVSNWKSVMMCFRLACNESVLLCENFFLTELN